MRLSLLHPVSECPANVRVTAIAYYNSDAPVALRREFLRKAYLFDCLCEKCETQAAEQGMPLRRPAAAIPAFLPSASESLPAMNGSAVAAAAEANGLGEGAPATGAAKKNKKKKSKAALNGTAGKQQLDAKPEAEVVEKELTLEQKAERMFAKKQPATSSTPWYEDVDE